jgi:2-keto-3-deoxy-L-rhamnonate aldolase RhmA
VNSAKQKLAAGRLVLCMGLRQARSVDVSMIAAQAGFDAVYVDLEHSPLSLETTSILCAGTIGLGITPLVRVPAHGQEWISRVLDGGAQGVIVPHVSSAAEAKAVISHARFPPLGRRSVMGATPALGYAALPLAETNRRLNEETLVIAMIETPAGVEQADAIAAVPGIDVLLIGSNDLCTELGIPGELRHPKLREAYETVARACAKHRRVLGVGGIRGDIELQQDLIGMGARFLIAGNDVSYLAAAARSDIEAIRRIQAQ